MTSGTDQAEGLPDNVVKVRDTFSRAPPRTRRHSEATKNKKNWFYQSNTNYPPTSWPKTRR